MQSSLLQHDILLAPVFTGNQQQNYKNHQKFETILTTQIKTMLFVCVFQHILVL